MRPTIKVFVSYSSYDRDALVEASDVPTPLLRRLRALESEGFQIIWDKNDGELSSGLVAGDDFQRVIGDWIDEAGILIFLLTQDSLNSRECCKEVLRFRRRCATNALLKIVPFCLRVCEYKRVSWLKVLEILPSPTRPYARLSPAEQDRELLRLVSHIRGIGARMRGK
jgi:hypothetical protein